MANPGRISSDRAGVEAFPVLRAASATPASGEPKVSADLHRTPDPNIATMGESQIALPHATGVRSDELTTLGSQRASEDSAASIPPANATLAHGTPFGSANVEISSVRAETHFRPALTTASIPPANATLANDTPSGAANVEISRVRRETPFRPAFTAASIPPANATLADDTPSGAANCGNFQRSSRNSFPTGSHGCVHPAGQRDARRRHAVRRRQLWKFPAFDAKRLSDRLSRLRPFRRPTRRSPTTRRPAPPLWKYPAFDAKRLSDQLSRLRPFRRPTRRSPTTRRPAPPPWKYPAFDAKRLSDQLSRLPNPRLPNQRGARRSWQHSLPFARRAPIEGRSRRLGQSGVTVPGPPLLQASLRPARSARSRSRNRLFWSHLSGSNSPPR